MRSATAFAASLLNTTPCHLLPQIPAITRGDWALFESGAIILYLAEIAGELSDARSRAKATQWVLFATSTLANALFIDQVVWPFRGGNSRPA